MTRHMASQHEAHTDQMVALTRQCIVALDQHSDPARFFSYLNPDRAAETLTYDETVAYLAAKEAFEALSSALDAMPAPAPLDWQGAFEDDDAEPPMLDDLASIWEGPPPGFGLNDDAHPLAAWLPVIGWLGFAGCVWLLVWAWFS